VPSFPLLDGVGFRMFAGATDYPDFARIMTASAQGERFDHVETAEALASYYDHLERCDPSRDLLVVEVDGVAVGFSRVWWDQEPDGPRIYAHECYLDPDLGARGIGSALFNWNEERLGEIATEHDVADKQLEVAVNDLNAGGTALARDAGYEPVAYEAKMVRPSVEDLPDHRLPEGLELRPVTEDQLRTIFEADIDAFRDHWGFVEPGDGWYASFLEFPYNDLTLWKVAWDDEGIAGQVRPFIDTAQNDAYNRRRGYTEAISTARRWRRRGVAKALIVESIRELAKRGMTEVALGVHTENPNGAFDLYAGLGYEEIARWTTYRKPL
jgi:ribosomal protein S18 acetylase RimI-like enzyme